SYNMAVNLVRRHDRETAMRVLNSSFAQFDADRSIVRLERELAAKEREAGALRAELTCDLGDVLEYVQLRQEAAEATSSGRGSEEVRAAVAELVPGDV